MTKRQKTSGVHCPSCGAGLNYVSDSRISEMPGSVTVRRRRICGCGHRFTTFELTAVQVHAIEQAALSDLMGALSNIIAQRKPMADPDQEAARNGQ